MSLAQSIVRLPELSVPPHQAVLVVQEPAAYGSGQLTQHGHDSIGRFVLHRLHVEGIAGQMLADVSELLIVQPVENAEQARGDRVLGDGLWVLVHPVLTGGDGRTGLIGFLDEVAFLSHVTGHRVRLRGLVASPAGEHHVRETGFELIRRVLRTAESMSLSMAGSGAACGAVAAPVGSVIGPHKDYLDKSEPRCGRQSGEFST